MARIWVLRAVVIRLDGRQFPSSQQQHSLGVPERGSRCRTPHGLSGCLGQRNFEGFVHVNVLHDRRTVFDTRKISKDRYLIVVLLLCLM